MARFVKIPKKVTTVQNPMTSQSGRVALLTGVMAGTVGHEELERAVTLDVQPRPYRRPCVAFGVRFDSVSDAARAHLGPRHMDQFNNTAQNIARWCTQDCWEGFYWCE